MKLTRTQLAERRVTRIAARIRAGVLSARLQASDDLRTGRNRDGRWEAWEKVIKDKVRELVREARLTNRGPEFADEDAA
jgi:hypothetical protein